MKGHVYISGQFQTKYIYVTFRTVACIYLILAVSAVCVRI